MKQVIYETVKVRLDLGNGLRLKPQTIAYLLVPARERDSLSLHS